MSGVTAPVAAVELDAHAHGAPVRAVGQHAHARRPHARLQVVLLLEVRVRVARQDLPTDACVRRRPPSQLTLTND